MNRFRAASGGNMFTKPTWLYLLAVGCWCLLARAEAYPAASPDQSYGLGQIVGNCLVRGCQVYLATITDVGPPQSEAGNAPENALVTQTIAFSVDEWIYGKSDGGETQGIFVQEPEWSKTAIGPWNAWEGVDPQAGSQVLVVRRVSPPANDDEKMQPLVLVTSSADLIAQVRDVAAQQQAFENARSSVANVPQLLTGKNEPFFAGYIFAYLHDYLTLHDVSLTVKLLTSMIGNAGVPQDAWTEIPNYIVAEYYRLSKPAGASLTRQLAQVAGSENADTAQGGFSALFGLAGAGELDLKSALNSDQRAQLAETYHSLVSTGTIPQASSAFEDQLQTEN